MSIILIWLGANKPTRKTFVLSVYSLKAGYRKLLLVMVFIASLLDAQHQRDSVKNKPASLLVVLLGKALFGIPPF